MWKFYLKKLLFFASIFLVRTFAAISFLFPTFVHVQWFRFLFTFFAAAFNFGGRFGCNRFIGRWIFWDDSRVQIIIEIHAGSTVAKFFAALDTGNGTSFNYARFIFHLANWWIKNIITFITLLGSDLKFSQFDEPVT